jgi:hypothetical protein
VTHAESDLAAPVTAFLAAQGWTVRSEVKDCDVAAVRGGDLLVVELKRSITLALLVQAVRRQRLTDTVYLAVPRPGSVWPWRRANRGVLHLLRRLELGLLFVSREAGREPVEVVLQPRLLARRRKASARRAVLEEIDQRSADYNTAGSTRRKLMTAYREQAIRIACCLARHDQLAPRDLREMGTGPKTQAILYDNVYGWFQRMGAGAYRLAARGIREIKEYPELARRFMAESEAHPAPRDDAGPAAAGAPSDSAPAARPVSRSRRTAVSSRKRRRK